MTKAQKTLKEKKAFKDEIANCFQKDEADEIWRSSESRLEKLFRDHETLPKGVNVHTDSFIFPLQQSILLQRNSPQKKPIPSYRTCRCRSSLIAQNPDATQMYKQDSASFYARVAARSSMHDKKI